MKRAIKLIPMINKLVTHKTLVFIYAVKLSLLIKPSN